MPALAASIQTLAIDMKRKVGMLLLIAKRKKHLNLAIPVLLPMGLCSGALAAEAGLRPLIVPLTVLIACPTLLGSTGLARGAAITLDRVVQALLVAWSLKRADRVFGATP